MWPCIGRQCSSNGSYRTSISPPIFNAASNKRQLYIIGWVVIGCYHKMPFAADGTRDTHNYHHLRTRVPYGARLSLLRYRLAAYHTSSPSRLCLPPPSPPPTQLCLPPPQTNHRSHSHSVSRPPSIIEQQQSKASDRKPDRKPQASARRTQTTAEVA